MNKELVNQINALITRLRQGDRDAENALNGRYVPRIRFYVYRNVWYSDIKDPENLVQDIWLKLRAWFKENFIKRSEIAVVFNLVRSSCRDQARKDKREIAYGKEPYRSGFTAKEDDQNKAKEPLLPVHKELLIKRFAYDYGNVNVPEKIKTFEARSKNILSKCLRNLSPTQQVVIDLRFYQEYIYADIGDRIGVATERAYQVCEEALGILQRCFRRHNIRSVGDLL